MNARTVAVFAGVAIAAAALGAYLATWQAQMASDRFQVVALSVDQQGLAIARKFYAETEIKALPLYIDRTAKAAFTLDAGGLPATLLVDPQGREVGRHLGAVKWDSPEVMEHLRRRVNSPP